MGFEDRLKLAELAMEPGAREVERCSDQVELRPREKTGDAAVVLVQIFGQMVP